MSAADWAVLGGAFLGGAIPWLEAIVVIPAGILAGAPPLLVVLAAVVGNLITVWLAAYFGEQIRNWWLRRREKRRATSDTDAATAPAKKQARQQRIDRVMKKWGLPGLAILGPLGLGTQLSALAAVAMGVRARAAFVWVGLATILWATVAAVLTTLGVSAFGLGAAG